VEFGEVAQALEIVKLDATIPKRHQATLAQLAQDAVHVDRGEPQRIGQKPLGEPSPTSCRRSPSSSRR